MLSTLDWRHVGCCHGVKAVTDSAAVQFKLRRDSNGAEAPSKLLVTVLKDLVEASVSLEHAVYLLVTSTTERGNATLFFVVVAYKHFWKVCAVDAIALASFTRFELGQCILGEDLCLRNVSRSVRTINGCNVAVDVEAYLESSASPVDFVGKVPGGERELLWNTEVGPIDG